VEGSIMRIVPCISSTNEKWHFNLFYIVSMCHVDSSYIQSDIYFNQHYYINIIILHYSYICYTELMTIFLLYIDTPYFCIQDAWIFEFMPYIHMPYIYIHMPHIYIYTYAIYLSWWCEIFRRKYRMLTTSYARSLKSQIYCISKGQITLGQITGF